MHTVISTKKHCYFHKKHSRSVWSTSTWGNMEWQFFEGCAKIHLMNRVFLKLCNGREALREAGFALCCPNKKSTLTSFCFKTKTKKTLWPKKFLLQNCYKPKPFLSYRKLRGSWMDILTEKLRWGGMKIELCRTFFKQMFSWMCKGSV